MPVTGNLRVEQAVALEIRYEDSCFMDYWSCVFVVVVVVDFVAFFI